jgi:putative effector of murein hydrolase
MAFAVGEEMGEGPQRERVFVRIAGLVGQGADEARRSDVVHEVAQGAAASGVVAHVLGEAPP